MQQTMNPYLQQYKKTQVETATQEEVLILLYDGAIQFLNKAKVGIEHNDNELLNKNILACQRIINEFIDTLDMENGGEFAFQLKNLYEYFIRTLVKANMKKDIAKINEVQQHLRNLRETWQKAINIANSQKKNVLIDEQADEFDEDDDESEE